MSVIRLALLALALTPTLGCAGGRAPHEDADRGRSVPSQGACRSLTPADVDRPSDASPTVPCARRHTAETFLVGGFPAARARAGYTSSSLGRYVYSVCQPAFVEHLGGDESIARRTLYSWAWFRPSRKSWAAGRHWFRCDVVGGPDDARSYRPLPRTTRGALAARPPEDWMLCARGARFADAARVPCAQRHDWRAVTTIKVGAPADPYPGDRLTLIRSQQFCSDSVGGWLGYPATNYEYATTVLRETDWRLGDRRSMCWARTAR